MNLREEPLFDILLRRAESRGQKEVTPIEQRREQWMAFHLRSLERQILLEGLSVRVFFTVPTEPVLVQQRPLQTQQETLNHLLKRKAEWAEVVNRNIRSKKAMRSSKYDALLYDFHKEQRACAVNSESLFYSATKRPKSALIRTRPKDV